jgi:uncharacterized membrane protein YkoI
MGTPYFGDALFTYGSLTSCLRNPSGSCQEHKGIVRIMNSRLLCFSALLAVSLFAASPLAASAKDDAKAIKKAQKKLAQEEALAALRRGEILPLVEILRISTSHVQGDVIEVEFKGGPVYEVKILTADGSVREVVLDARTGALIKIKDD